MKTLRVCGVLAFFVATAAFAQLSQENFLWGQGPARFLMTKEELQQWTAIKNDADAKAFIDLFWAKRDPTPDTPRNEFREDFEARVAFADKTFGAGQERGALSDRGKAFILLGPPERVSGRAGQAAAGMSTFAVGPGNIPTNANGGVALGTRSEGNLQYWMYAHQKKPKFVPQSDFTLAFSDEGHEDWKIATTERVNPDMLFDLAVKAAIVSPNLTKAPEFKAPPPPRVTSFKSADAKTGFEQLRSGTTQTVGGANVTWAEFMAPTGEQFVSAQLYAPAASGITAGQKVTFVAVLENKDGNIVEVKENETTMEAAGTGAYVDTSVRLDPGTYTATLGVVANGKVLAGARTPMTVQGLDPAGAGVSPLFLAASVYPLKTDWTSTDPFTFGGIKVVPKGDDVFPNKGDLWYFVQLRNPGLTDAEKPNVRVALDITGTTAKGPVKLKLPMKDASLAKYDKTQYGLGLALPLDGFPPGDYTLKVRIQDVVLGKDYNLEKTFKIQG